MSSSDPDSSDRKRGPPPDDHGGRSRPASEGEGSVVRISVPGMDCASCAGKVENGLRRVEGVPAYDTRPTTGGAVVSTTPR